MSPVPPADTAPVPAPPAGPPTPADVLRWCAAAAPGLWFPSVHAARTGVPRDSLDEPLLRLRQAGLIQVGDWVRGRGQGYTLTAAGQKALADPEKFVEAPPEPPEVPDDIPPEDADLAHVPDPAEAPAPPRDPGLTAYDRGEMTREAFLAPRPAVLTPVLLVANAGWFLVGLVSAWRMNVPAEQYLKGQSVEVLRRIGAADGWDLLSGEWWRLITAGLVHIGGLHLVVNLFSLAMLGPVAEGLWARWRFAGLYALSGLAAVCAAVALHPGAVVAGASGSIWGLQLAVLAWLVRYREHLPPEIVAAWLRRFALVVGVNLVVNLLPGVSWEGHLAGAFAGFAGAVFCDLTWPGVNRRQLITGLAGLAALLGLSVGGLLAAVQFAPQWQAMGAVVRAVKAGEGQPRAAGTPVVPVGRVEVAHRAVTLALVARGPEAVRAARGAVDRLKEDARVADRLPAGPVRDYLTEVGRYAELADDRLAAGRVPAADEWKALADQLARVEQAWAAAVAK